MITKLISYFNEHMDNEIISLSHFINAINYGYEIIMEHGNKKWPHIAEIKKEKWFGYKKSEKWEDYEDYYFPEVIKGSKSTYDSVPHWTFLPEDKKYINDHLKIGTCPLCESHVETLSDGESHCFVCEATYNIPYDKNLQEVEEELFSLLVAKYPEYNSKEY